MGILRNITILVTILKGIIMIPSSCLTISTSLPKIIKPLIPLLTKQILRLLKQINLGQFLPQFVDKLIIVIIFLINSLILHLSMLGDLIVKAF